MRRKDREMSEEFAWSVVDKCEWATLATVDKDGMPYCVTLSIVRKGNEIYFHSAMEGYKTDCFRLSDRVAMTFVGDTERLKDKFTTRFESAFARGRIVEITDEEEKIRALRLLCERHTPTNMDNFDVAVNASLHRTAIWKVTVEEISGKCKR